MRRYSNINHLQAISWSSGALTLHISCVKHGIQLITYAHGPRRTVDGQSRYFIREINNIFVVGQTLPAVSQAKQQLMDMPTSQAATRRATRWIRIIIKKLLVKHGGVVKQSYLKPFWPEWSDRDWTMFLKVNESTRESRADLSWYSLSTFVAIVRRSCSRKARIVTSSGGR
jgi:hypothetical protein